MILCLQFFLYFKNKTNRTVVIQQSLYPQKKLAMFYHNSFAKKLLLIDFLCDYDQSIFNLLTQ